MSATQMCAAAKGHAEDAVRQIHTAVEELKKVMSLIIGTTEDAIMAAGGHMRTVQQEVGSTTAGEIATGYEAAAESIQQDVLLTLKITIDSLDPIRDGLLALGDRTEQLAAQLGA